MFQLDKKQYDTLAEWKKQQDDKVVKKQRDSNPACEGVPYYGAIGGAYTYSFTPTSLGCVVKVQNGLTKDEIDLTDYNMW